jgi:hypothetical protein
MIPVKEAVARSVDFASNIAVSIQSSQYGAEITGFQAQETLGRKLVEKMREVRVFRGAGNGARRDFESGLRKAFLVLGEPEQARLWPERSGRSIGLTWQRRGGAIVSGWTLKRNQIRNSL